MKLLRELCENSIAITVLTALLRERFRINFTILGVPLPYVSEVDPLLNHSRNRKNLNYFHYPILSLDDFHWISGNL